MHTKCGYDARTARNIETPSTAQPRGCQPALTLVGIGHRAPIASRIKPHKVGLAQGVGVASRDGIDASHHFAIQHQVGGR